MSLNQLIQDTHKEWLNIRVNDLAVDGKIQVENIDANDIKTNTLTVNIQENIAGSLVPTGDLSAHIGEDAKRFSSVKTTQLGGPVAPVTTGIYLPGDPFPISQALNYYYSFVQEANYSGPWPASPLRNILFTRIGNLVCMSLENYNAVASVASPIAVIPTNPIPAEFMPGPGSSSFRFPIWVFDNNVSIAGNIRIVNSLLIAIHPTGFTANFSGMGPGGTGFEGRPFAMWTTN